MALEDLTPAQVDGAILANVVPAAGYPLETLCRRYFKAEPMIVGEARGRSGDRR